MFCNSYNFVDGVDDLQGSAAHAALMLGTCQELGWPCLLCVCVSLTLANPSARVRCHSLPQRWQSH